MLHTENKNQLKALGIDVDALEAAIKADNEISITIPTGTLFTADELTQRDNVKTENGRLLERQEVAKAITKEAKNRLNIEIEGERIGDIVQSLAKKLSEQTGDAKIKSLSDQVNALLSDKEKLATEVEKATRKASMVEFEFNQYQQFPQNKSSLMTDKEYFTLLKARGIEVKEDGVYRNGQLVIDEKTQGALPHKDAYNKIFTEFNWVSQQQQQTNTGGRGAGNSGASPNGGKFLNHKEATEAWVLQNPGKNAASPEAMQFVQDQGKGVMGYWEA